MRITFYKSIVATILLFMCAPFNIKVVAQQKFPVTASVSLSPPYSVYVNDYIAPGSNLLKCNFVFNDFREPTWQVRLRVRIESTDLRLETRPEFTPLNPLTVTPGTSIPLSGIDFAQYFDFKNLNITGSAANIFLQNGRFPEGNYIFCVEILDYPTGILLSNTSCASAWIRLNDPPKVISPLCGAFIDPTLPLNIPFQWQLSNAISPNATLGTEFKVVVYELTDPYANPFTAIANGKVLQIFESDALSQPSFTYTPSSPTLDIGKTYVYQIRARDKGGKDLFKNNGLSEVCWFHFGYPENAKNTILAPENGKAFKKSELPYFKWSAPDLRLRNQPFIYELKIVQLQEGQELQQAINDNPVWHLQKAPQTFSERGLDLVISKKLKPALEYAWQITTYSGSQTVAKSEVLKFVGPPLVDRFYAGKHIVVVQNATSNDSLNFSGTGKVRVGATDSVEVAFTGLKLKRLVSYWVLTNGDINKELQSPAPITLNPKKSVNGPATFYPRALKLNSTELAMEGEVHWALPHPVKSGNVALVKSDRTWLNYDKYTLLGSAKLSNQNQFELLEPYDLSLRLSPESDFLISNNQFELRAQGEIVFPDKVKGKQKGKVKVSFPRTNQLFYMPDLEVVMENEVALVENTRIYFQPSKITIDLSEEQSPENQQGDLLWKGVYVHSFDLHYNSFTDKHSQLKLQKDIKHSFSGTEAANTNAWIDGQGLNLSISKDFNKDTLEFNSFKGTVSHLDLTIERNKVSTGILSGGIVIPVFSIEQLFPFTTSITDDGFRPGYLNDIEGKDFTFNKGAGEQEVNLTVKRGAFAEQRLIDLVIDLEWPALGISVSSISGFKVWGDYRIGFSTPNGVRALDNQLSGTLSGYPVTFDAIAAGSSAGLYSFAVSGKASIGDDVSGDAGPPSVNVYSIMPNVYLPKTAEVSSSILNAQTNPEQYIQQVETEYATVGGNASNKLDQNEAEIKRKAEETLNNLTSKTTTVATLGQATNRINTGNESSTDPTASPKSGGLLAKLTPKQREIVKEIIETVVVKLTEPITEPINTKADSVNAKIVKEVNEIVAIAHKQVEEKVTSLVNSVAQQIISATKNEKVDFSSQIEQIAEVVTRSVVDEVKRSIAASLNNNITLPLTSLVKDDIAGSINSYIRETSVTLVIGSLEGELKLEDVPDVILQGTDTLLNSIADKVFDKINFSSLSSMVYSTANDAVKGINTGKIFNEIKASTSSIITNAIADQVNKLAANAAQELLGNTVGIEFPIDFASIAGKLAQGDVKGIFALDPVPVKLRTKVLDLNGLIHYQDDEPTYGDVWLGDIDVNVKAPKPFSLSATYITGKKDGISYWFAQIAPSDDKTVKLGDIMPRKARPLKQPIDMGVAKIVGISGRVYHHMKDAANAPIVPDANNKYGAYLNIVLFDGADNGKTMRLDVAGEINAAVTGDYVLNFEGDIQLMSNAAAVQSVDPTAAVKGIFRFNYNSAEQHFLGYGRVEVIKPGQLCASGSVLVDTKPGAWRVEIGSREDRIMFIPACAGWSPTGWLAVTQSEAELGLGVQYSMYVQTPTYNFVIVKANVALDAGLAFGIQAAIRYKPDFALLRAGVWADVWANVVINYKFSRPFADWKQFSLLSIYAKGDLLIIFEPKPTTLEGKVKGSVRLLSIVTINFDTGFSKQIG
jgi:hypothetical protein